MMIPDRTVPPLVTDFKNLKMPESRTFTLDNGVPVLVVSGAEAEVCRISLVWKGGVAESSIPAIPTLTMSLLQEGSVRHSGAQMASIFEFNGARLGSMVDSHHSSLMLFTLNSRIARVLPLLVEAVTSPALPADAFDVLRESALQNLALRQHKVEYQASKMLNKLAMGMEHPLARVDTTEDIENLEVADIRKWLDTMPPLSSGSFMVTVSGHVNPEIEAEINRTIGSLPMTDKKVHSNIVCFSPEAKQRVDISVEGALQSAVRFTVPAISRSHPDYISLRLLVMGLGGYFGSRLMDNVRERCGYTYGIQSHLLGYKEGAFVSISASTDNDTVEPLIDESLSEIRRLVTHPITGDELARLRRHALSSLAAQLDSPFDIMDYNLSVALGDFPQDYYENQVRAISALDSDLLTDMARKYLNADDFSIVVAGK